MHSLFLQPALTMQYNASQDMYEETGTDNNGNLRMEKLEHTVGTPFSVDRLFGYDTVNRLGSFTEPSKSQSFGYDAFGNLWQTGASGVPALRPNGWSWYLMTNGSVSNRLANTAYDEAGHQTLSSAIIASDAMQPPSTACIRDAARRAPASIRLGARPEACVYVGRSGLWLGVVPEFLALTRSVGAISNATRPGTQSDAIR